MSGGSQPVGGTTHWVPLLLPYGWEASYTDQVLSVPSPLWEGTEAEGAVLPRCY